MSSTRSAADRLPGPAAGALQPVGDGLSPAAAVVLLVLFALVGGGIDLLVGRGLRIVPDALFVLGCVVAAARVRPEGRRAVVAAPPLVYAALALAAGLTRDDGVPRTMGRQGLQLFTELVVGAPTLVLGTLAALVVVLVRAASERRR